MAALTTTESAANVDGPLMTMSSSFENRRVIIFRATGGTGLALARQLAERGCQLTLAARDQGRLDALASELHAEASNLAATDSAAVERCAADVSERHCRLDGVVNCARWLLPKPAPSPSDSKWVAVLGANLTSAFHILRSATARMMKSGEPFLVNWYCYAFYGERPKPLYYVAGQEDMTELETLRLKERLLWSTRMTPTPCGSSPC